MIEFGSEKENIFTMPFLIQELEEKDNILKIKVALPQKADTKDLLDDITNINIKNITEKAVPICADENEIYEIVFDSYIFHITRNESYTGPDDEEICKGKYFIIFEKSKLLKFMPQLVECGLIDAMYPEGYVHYGVYCQNHIIDIIAADEPEIIKISRQEN